jgi:subfamily B ATP-binding cassette protein HlyB/CyaB
MVALERERSEARRAGDAAASGAPLLGSLAIIARQHGVPLSASRLVHDYLPEGGELSLDRFFDIAAASGLRATRTRLVWDQLFKLGKGLPAIVLLRNGYAMVLRRTDEGPGFPRIILQDPNAPDLLLP